MLGPSRLDASPKIRNIESSLKKLSFTIVWKFILSNETYNSEIFSKLIPPKSIEKFLEEYLQTPINSFGKLYQDLITLIRLRYFSRSLTTVDRFLQWKVSQRKTLSSLFSAPSYGFFSCTQYMRSSNQLTFTCAKST